MKCVVRIAKKIKLHSTEIVCAPVRAIPTDWQPKFEMDAD